MSAALIGPGLSALVAAVLVLVVRMPRWADRVALVGASVALLWASWICTSYFAADGGLVADHLFPNYFSIDGLTAGLLPFEALLGLAALVATGRNEPKRVATVLAGEGCFLLLFAAIDVDVIFGLWTVAFVPGLLTSKGRSRRAFSFVAVGSTVPLVIARVTIFISGSSTHLPTLLADPIGAPQDAVFFWCMMAAVAVRTALFPFHAWLMVALESGALPLTILMLSARPGAFLLARIATPAAPEVARDAMLLVATGGLVTAIYGGLLGLAQEKPRRVIGAIAMSHSGLIVLGLCSGTAFGVTGALVQWMTVGVAVMGLGFVVARLEARLGDLEYARGLSGPLPGLSVAFLLFGVASVGFPGTLGFVGEDLLVHGLLVSNPKIAAAMVFATSLNGITLMRAFMRTFFGPVRLPAPDPIPMLRRERFVALALLLVLLGFGLLPAPLVASRDPSTFTLPVLQPIPAGHE